jgi:hypothetical protein
VGAVPSFQWSWETPKAQVEHGKEKLAFQWQATAEEMNWKHKLKERFRTYLPTSCHLDFSVTITYSYHRLE